MKSGLTNLKRYLKEPYPFFYANQKRLILFLGLITILSFGFSYFFEPFEINVNEHKIESMWILVIHAIIPLPIAYIYFNVLNRSKNSDTNWTLGQELFHLSAILLVIGVANFLIRDLIYTNPDNWSLRYFREEIRNTFLVGSLLLLVVLPLNLERLIHKHSSHLKKLSTKVNKDPIAGSIFIKTEVSIEDFELHIKDFMFAKVESNYTEIVTFSSGTINQKLIRITLKNLENQLNPFTSVIKTHRSYLVNLNAITSISGNAQGYQLTLENYSFSIPVSRSNIKYFNASFAKLS